MSSGDTARPAPDVEGLLRAWLQTQECKERGAHLLRADDFQGVCDGHLVEARLKAAKALTQEINHPAPPRERKGAAERSNRFLRGASPGTGRARLEIARRRREATLLVEQLHKCNKIGPRAALAARPAWPVARESPSSITGASAENTAPRRRHFVRMHSVTEQLDVEICQDDTSPCSTPARPSRLQRRARIQLGTLVRLLFITKITFLTLNTIPPHLNRANRCPTTPLLHLARAVSLIQ